MKRNTAQTQAYLSIFTDNNYNFRICNIEKSHNKHGNPTTQTCISLAFNTTCILLQSIKVGIASQLCM